MDTTTRSRVRRMVAEGCIREGDRFIWVCPGCCQRVGVGRDVGVIHRMATSHCLAHAYTDLVRARYKTSDVGDRGRGAKPPAGYRVNR